MKRFVLILMFSFILLKSFSQWGFGFINFEDTTNLFRIYIDTTIPNNIWQIGAPHKSFLTSARSLPNAIITDTINSYPINNNSVFYYRTSGDFNTKGHDAGLGFWYKMDSDTLIDFGSVEISFDIGATWYSLTSLNSYWVVSDSLLNVVTASWNSNDSIVFTGRTNGWYLFSSDIILPMGFLDSIIYRFTFHSSSLIAQRDGWMIDDIGFNTSWESIPENDLSCKIFPNPVEEIMTLCAKSSISDYMILNSLGYVIKRNENCQMIEHINVSEFTSGIYFIKIKFNNGSISTKKFVKI